MVIRQACVAANASMPNGKAQQKPQLAQLAANASMPNGQAQQKPQQAQLASNAQIAVAANSEKTTDTAELEKALKELERIDVHDAMHYEYAINQLSRYRKALKGQTDLPNLEKLLKSYPRESDAKILNLYYHYYFVRDHKQILKEIAQFNDEAANERLLFLKLICLNQLRASKKEMMPVVEALVTLAPRNERFAHLKLSIERRIEK